MPFAVKRLESQQDRMTLETQREMQKAPLLIFISQEIPHSKAAGSIVLMRLLSRWPTEKLLIWGPPPPENADKLNCLYIPFKPWVNRLQFSRFSSLAPPLSWLLPFSLPKKRHDDDAVVITVMQSSAYYKAAYRYAKRHKLALVIIVHDDPELVEPVRSWSKMLVRSFNRRVYNYATARFCISPEMELGLHKRFGAAGIVLYPNRSRELRPRPAELNSALRRGAGLVLGYAGSLVYGYVKRLHQLIPALQRSGVVLRIYSIHEPKGELAAFAEYAGASKRPSDVWERVKMECDAVILPYAFPPDEHQELYKTHFPSKLTEYLALGMPVIINGPPYATGVKWGLRNPDVAVTIATSDLEEIERCLRRLTIDKAYRVALGAGALRSAESEFCPEKIEELFAENIRLITSGSNRRSPQ